METPLNIRIPEPCHESWDGMSPKGKGRFCNSCSKVVIDFTKMDNEDILLYLRQAAGNKVCGRFNTSQVNHQTEKSIIPYERHFLSPFQKIAAMIITGFTLLLSSCKPNTTTIGETMGPPVRDSIEVRDTIQVDTVKVGPAPVKTKETFIEIPDEPLIGDTVISPYNIQGGVRLPYDIDTINRLVDEADAMID